MYQYCSVCAINLTGNSKPVQKYFSYKISIFVSVTNINLIMQYQQSDISANLVWLVGLCNYCLFRLNYIYNFRPNVKCFESRPTHQLSYPTTRIIKKYHYLFRLGREHFTLFKLAKNLIIIIPLIYNYFVLRHNHNTAKIIISHVELHLIFIILKYNELCSYIFQLSFLNAKVRFGKQFKCIINYQTYPLSGLFIRIIKLNLFNLHTTIYRPQPIQLLKSNQLLGLRLQSSRKKTKPVYDDAALSK